MTTHEQPDDANGFNLHAQELLQRFHGWPLWKIRMVLKEADILLGETLVLDVRAEAFTAKAKEFADAAAQGFPTALGTRGLGS
ncbi:hypothetical protein [Methylogaea oryzae]|uniref:Uncharacterized protein n=1 Tax=Methylogaea oryzae TaxID=1295382 RepID=A0A8D5AJ58_9GAMM|nr:hypothetical protein [Methylogaea oryzae]BBL69706.1 hypothetical protein MoryE10_03120 [Methylogaea oryzae]